MTYQTQLANVCNSKPEEGEEEESEEDAAVAAAVATAGFVDELAVPSALTDVVPGVTRSSSENSPFLAFSGSSCSLRNGISWP